MESIYEMDNKNILGFLLSPYGIPMIGAAIIAFIQGINEAIKSI